jgi:hypothetical protein
MSSDGMKLVRVCTGHYVMADRVTAVLVPEQQSVDGLVKEAKANHKLIPACGMFEIHGILVLNTKHVVLSAMKPEKLAEMIYGSKIYYVEVPKDKD